MVQLRTVFLIATMYITIIGSSSLNPDEELIAALAVNNNKDSCPEWGPMVERCGPIFKLFDSLIGTLYHWECPGIQSGSSGQQCNSGAAKAGQQYCITLKSLIDCVVPFNSECTYWVLEKASAVQHFSSLQHVGVDECQPDKLSIPSNPTSTYKNCPETKKMDEKCEEERDAVLGSTLATRLEGATLHTKEKIGIMCLDMKSLVDCMAEFKADCNEALFKNETETIASINDIYGSIPECSKKKLFIPKPKSKKTGHIVNSIMAIVVSAFYFVF